VRRKYFITSIFLLTIVLTLIKLFVDAEDTETNENKPSEDYDEAEDMAGKCLHRELFMLFNLLGRH
jgi:hypothetical protein